MLVSNNGVFEISNRSMLRGTSLLALAYALWEGDFFWGRLGRVCLNTPTGAILVILETEGFQRRVVFGPCKFVRNTRIGP